MARRVVEAVTERDHRKLTARLLVVTADCTHIPGGGPPFQLGFETGFERVVLAGGDGTKWDGKKIRTEKFRRLASAIIEPIGRFVAALDILEACVSPSRTTPITR